MAEADVEVVRQIYDAAARRDAEAVFSLYDEDVEWDGSRSHWTEVIPGRFHFRGHAALREFFSLYFEMWEDFDDNLQELIDAGDRVVSVVTSRARGRASGAQVEWPGQAGVWTVRDGKVVRVVWFPSRAEALASF